MEYMLALSFQPLMGMTLNGQQQRSKEISWKMYTYCIPVYSRKDTTAICTSETVIRQAAVHGFEGCG